MRVSQKVLERRAYMRKWRRKPEQLAKQRVRQMSPEQKAYRKKYYADRYKNDPKFRAYIIERVLAYQKRKRDEKNRGKKE